MSSFRDRTALITGAASGIGRQFALDLAAEGARVAALDRSAAGLDALAADLKARGVAADRFACAAADVTDWLALHAAVRGLEERLGPTDLLVAAAGLACRTSALDYPAEAAADIIRVNLIGVSHSVAAVLPGMRERRRGHLVGLASLAGYRGVPPIAAYSASKAGVIALLDAFRVELAPLGIAVTTICPGFIRTPMTTRPGNSPPPSVCMLEVDVAVATMLRAVRARRASLSFPTGLTWRMRLLRYLPRPLADWLTARNLRRLQRSEQATS
jgi:NAD(P)-dependent dehydrogenase (short-subunit alcohol dehydrogenase family)